MADDVSAYAPRPHPPRDRQDVCAALAAALFSVTPSVSYESAISRAALSATETPVVRLPARKACLDCPHYRRRLPAVLWCPDETVFDDLVQTPAHDCAARKVASPPPKILAGVDLAKGPHELVTPGFDDLARIEDPTVLADALYFNQVQPACACTKALFDAADHEGWAGVRLDFLRQEAALQARQAGSAPPVGPGFGSGGIPAPWPPS